MGAGAGAAGTATLVAHLLFLTDQLQPDEGGYAMVARFWGTGGGYLYGPSWVDRPPLLIAVFRLADALGAYGVRLVATATAVALVAAVAWTTSAIRPGRAASWAAWTAAALACSTWFQAEALNGELVASTWVAVSLGCAVRAVDTDRGRTGAAAYGAAAALTGAAAVLTKQNFVDAWMFCGVLGILTWLTRHRSSRPPRHLGAATVGFAAGLVASVAAFLWWADAHGGAGAWLHALYGFRRESIPYVAQTASGNARRAAHLVVIGLFTGLLPLIGYLAVRHRHRLRRGEPVAWALAAAVSVELVGLVLGLHFWTHYALALTPTVAVAAGLTAAGTAGRGTPHLLVCWAVGVTAATVPFAAWHIQTTPSDAFVTGRWLAASAAPGDTVVIPYSHPNAVAASGLRPGYPYSWWLPAHTLDPDHSLLRALLTAPYEQAAAPGSATAEASHRAPTWVVRWEAKRRSVTGRGEGLGASMRRHYYPVARVCGHMVWLRNGVSRELAAIPDAQTCGTADASGRVTK